MRLRSKKTKRPGHGLQDYGEASQPERALTRDEMLDDIALCWLTDTGTSSAQLYWEITPTTSTRWTSPSLLPFPARSSRHHRRQRQVRKSGHLGPRGCR